MTGLCILLGFNLLGLILEKTVGVPVPANVLGLILFVAALFLKIVKVEWVEQSADFLLKHMMLFFAPIIVGTISFFSILRQYGFTIVISLVASTLIVMLVSGGVAAFVGRIGSGNKPKKDALIDL
ncbi:hypothetical protein SD70_05755 [Gordoniibacillus kamchatkensis]|uniref:CidA/LrgA family protein n=1 Tax=Gordoniibacillus kamchatkensis TaxID=1590651 RepID=A0ABR5AKZ5_9BACL|nr:CidA/LrgA family protein [Paenibacillus sp. VKM B-2647]KIL41631.1 hypothetical protein SD70_05755 [Paenibacillus sp. VKM B-2647]